ncbi:hypothetical protein A6E12_03445 [Aliivibrio fischeri]|uniref:hypothetical protein n=1 Tax=Aliivibrio fischeri TaxID=668 RepID=UPI00080DC3A4|nr:hypothetical protein [Aliivibrio fischeri]OCH22529.1 hypothetical protein A6E12_03445 [Aliivibrio fischeri]
MTYIDKFIESVRFLEKFDKQHKKMKINYDDFKKHILKNKNDADLTDFLSSKLDEIASSFLLNSTADPVNQCHNFSQSFYDNWSSQQLGQLAPVAISIGTVAYDSKEIYEVSRGSIKRLINEGFNPNKSLNVHVWLTFSDMTVLDLTIVPTLIDKGVAELSDFDGKDYVIWREEEASKLQYFPLLQDNRFLYKVDKIKQRI